MKMRRPPQVSTARKRLLRLRPATTTLLLPVVIATALVGCGGATTSTTAEASIPTTTSATATAIETSTTTEASSPTQPPATKVMIPTTTLPAGGPGPAKVVASVSIDGSEFQEDWGPIPCLWQDVERSVMEGVKMVTRTVRVCEWPFWIRVTEENGVAVLIERHGYFYYDLETGEEFDAGKLCGTFQAWQEYDHVLPPHGVYEREFLLRSEDGVPDLAGKTFVLKLDGHDANGNEFEFEVPAICSPPS
ncbi:MAG: hypothetical protein JW990_12190 [Thermoleophilia bacterium]|nr:hypothetical protein [Thermoleophilia bacterium]